MIRSLRYRTALHLSILLFYGIIIAACLAAPQKQVSSTEPQEAARIVPPPKPIEPAQTELKSETRSKIISSPAAKTIESIPAKKTLQDKAEKKIYRKKTVEKKPVTKKYPQKSVKKTSETTVAQSSENIPPPIAPQKKEYSVQQADQDVIAEFNGITITRKTYNQTKVVLEEVVARLNKITDTKNYAEWKKLLSKRYQRKYLQPQVLKKVSESLPVKGMKLKSLQDYFNFVFVPAHRNVRIDEIKYLSPYEVNVIMDKGSVSLIVYKLSKEGNDWLLEP